LKAKTRNVVSAAALLSVGLFTTAAAADEPILLTVAEPMPLSDQ
jgi:hypothetical protein